MKSESFLEDDFEVRKKESQAYCAGEDQSRTPAQTGYRTPQTRVWKEDSNVAKQKILDAFKDPFKELSSTVIVNGVIINPLEVSVKETRDEMKPPCPRNTKGEDTFYKDKISGWVVTVKGTTLVGDELEKWATDHFSTKALVQSLLVPKAKEGVQAVRPKFQVTSDATFRLIAACRTIANVEGFCGEGKEYNAEKADSLCASSICFTNSADRDACCKVSTA